MQSGNPDTECPEGEEADVQVSSGNDNFSQNYEIKYLQNQSKMNEIQNPTQILAQEPQNAIISVQESTDEPQLDSQEPGHLQPPDATVTIASQIFNKLTGQNLWEPRELPHMAEDLEDNTVTYFFNTLAGNNSIHITLQVLTIENEDFDENCEESDTNPRYINSFDWTNISDFRNTYAEQLLFCDEDIRMIYFIVSSLMTKFDPNFVSYEFSVDGTIDLSEATFHYWRVKPEFLEVTPIVPLQEYSLNTLNLQNEMMARYQIISNLISQNMRLNESQMRNRERSLAVFTNYVQNINQNTEEIIERTTSQLAETIDTFGRNLNTQKDELFQMMKTNNEHAQHILCERNKLVEQSNQNLCKMIVEAQQSIEQAKQAFNQNIKESEDEINEIRSRNESIMKEIHNQKTEIVQYRGEIQEILAESKKCVSNFRFRIEELSKWKPEPLNLQLDLKESWAID